jgi:chromate transporter
MEILKLVLTFLKVGAVSFGGGWTIVGLIHDEVVGSGLMSEEAFRQAVAIAQVTPGPVALNVATLSGYMVSGVLGALAATLAVIAVPLAAMAAAALVAGRLRFLSKARLAESFRIGALSMTAMTAWSLAASGGFSWRAALFSLLSFLSSAFTKIHPALVILACGLLNLGIGFLLPGAR